MIHQVEGDILKSRAQVIAHGIAANDPMNQGLALALHQKFPSMHKDFHHWCHVAHPEPGAAWMWAGTDGVRIVNLITQQGGYGHGSRPGKATTKFVSDALKALAKMTKQEGFTSIALPRVATGVGSLSWDDVWPLVQQRLGELDLPIFVYAKYVPDQQAKEPGL